VVPLFRVPHAVFTMIHWRLSGYLFDSYWILGAVAGAASALLLTRWDRREPRDGADLFDTGRLPAMLSLVAAVITNLVFGMPVAHFAAAELVLSVALGAGVLWLLRRPESALEPWISYHPFLLALLLMAPVWLATEGLDAFGPVTKAVAVVVCLF